MDNEDKLSSLLDDDNFLQLTNRFGRFNLFEAVGSVRRELNHSNFLAFLLSPNRPHGLGAEPLRRVLRRIVETLDKGSRPIGALEIAVGDLDEAIVYRERDNIDLLVEVRALRLAVVIENKVGAEASDGQLQRYADIARRSYPDWKLLFVFLTPEGRDPEHKDYCSLSYIDLEQIVSTFADAAEPQSEIALILHHYSAMLRTHVVEDEKLKELALRIYEQHKEALDFVFSCRPTAESQLSLAKELINSQPELISDVHVNTIARFAPRAWEAEWALNACPKDIWTKTGRNMLFEIKTFKTETYDFSDRTLLSLISGPADQELRKYLFASARQKPGLFVGAGTVVGKQWVTLYSKELLSKAAAQGMDSDQKAAAVTTAWENFVLKELPELTEAVVEIAKSAPLP